MKKKYSELPKGEILGVKIKDITPSRSRIESIKYKCPYCGKICTTKNYYADVGKVYSCREYRHDIVYVFTYGFTSSNAIYKGKSFRLDYVTPLERLVDRLNDGETK